MRRIICISFFIAALLSSCRPGNVIPRDDMSELYYDFYMADRYLEAINDKDLGDSVKIYVPIIEDHGYSFEDYQTSVAYYLHHAEDLVKIFKGTEKMLKSRRDHLESVLAAEKKRNRKWRLLDSLDIYGDGIRYSNSYYRALRLLFFKPDTMEVTSPAIDSVILNHITSAYFLYEAIPPLYDSVSIIKSEEVDSTFIKALKVEKIGKVKKMEPQEDDPLEPEERADGEFERIAPNELQKFRKKNIDLDDKKKNIR